MLSCICIGGNVSLLLHCSIATMRMVLILKEQK